jgi:hypothetical protein
MGLKRLRTLYPLPFALFAPLALLASNVAEVHLQDGLRSLAFSLGLAALVLFITRRIVRRPLAASLLTTFYLLLFFSYGHLYQALDGTQVLGEPIARHRYFLTAWPLLFGFGTWVALRRIQNHEAITIAASTFALVAVCLPVVQLGFFFLRQNIGETPSMRASSFLETLEAPQLVERRDVYYVVLDGYARDDSLKEVFDYDNSEFLDGLRALGFFVAECSRSNYPKTRISLISTLNMEYLDTLGVMDNRTTGKTARLIRHNLVRQAFGDLGYTSVAFETNFNWTEWEDAELYLSRRTSGVEAAAQHLEEVVLNDFELLFLKSTMFRTYFDLSGTLFDRLFPESVLTTTAVALADQPRIAHYERTMFVLDTLANLPEIDKPLFVFAHIVSPHGPYVFDQNGSFTPDAPNDSKPAYVEQVRYLNNRLLQIIPEIIGGSHPAPIIVIQGDHGAPGTERDPDRMKILNAYFLPGEGGAGVYPAITPVNTFRLIFDAYFGADLELLDDVSYHSTADDFFDFTVYPDDRPGCEAP